MALDVRRHQVRQKNARDRPSVSGLDRATTSIANTSETGWIAFRSEFDSVTILGGGAAARVEMLVAARLIDAGSVACEIPPPKATAAMSAPASVNFDRFFAGIERISRRSSALNRFNDSAAFADGDAWRAGRLTVPDGLTAAVGTVSVKAEEDSSVITVQLRCTFKGLRLRAALIQNGRSNGIKLFSLVVEDDVHAARRALGQLWKVGGTIVSRGMAAEWEYGSRRDGTATVSYCDIST